MSNPAWFTPVGVVTVGTGTGASNGQYNASDYGGDFGAALSAAVNTCRYVMVLPGLYTQSSVPTIAGDDIQIEGKGSPKITLTSTASTRAATITGSRVKISGLWYTSATFVASSTFFNVTGNECSFDDNYWTCSATDGSNSTPMWYVTMGTTSQGVWNPRITRNRFHSAKGVGFAHVAGSPDSGTTTGSGLVFAGNHLGVDGTTTPEKFYCGLWMDSAGECVVTGNRAHGLGDGTDKGYSLYLFTTSDAQSEAQHCTFTGNSNELITSQHVFRGDGCRFLVMTGNQFGRMGGNGASEGTIHLTDNTGTGTDGGDINISANNFHNASTSAGRTIWIEDVDTVVIDNNTFSLCNGTQITVSTSAINVSIGPNRYKMASGTTNMIQLVASAYTGLWIYEPAIPSGCTLTSAQPLSGAVINGIVFGNDSPALDKNPGLRQFKCVGATNTNTFNVSGITTGDTLVSVVDITNKTVRANAGFTVGAGVITNGTGVDLSAATLIVTWYDA